MFLSMLHEDDDINNLEWQMYLDWYNLFKINRYKSCILYSNQS